MSCNDSINDKDHMSNLDEKNPALNPMFGFDMNPEKMFGFEDQDRKMPDKMPPRMPADDRECIDKMPLAMSYVPRQTWKGTYEVEKALEQGTIFPELDLPFLGYKGAKQND